MLKSLSIAQQNQDRLGGNAPEPGKLLPALGDAPRLNTSNSVWLFSRQTVTAGQGKRC